MFLSFNTDDLYEDISKDLEFASMFDFQTYKDDHPLFSFDSKVALLQLKKDNKDVLGKFKDEAEGKYITEMCFLRAKMYSVLIQGEIDKKTNEKKIDEKKMKAKGVKSSVMKNKISHDLYKDCLFAAIDDRDTLKQQCEFYKLGSKRHTMLLEPQTKVSLSHFDDKRYYLDVIKSLPLVHYSVSQLLVYHESP